MDLKEKAVLAVDALEKEYPDAQCSLVYDPEKAYELLISTRLSAQCTDARVNIVTKRSLPKIYFPSGLCKCPDRRNGRNDQDLWTV